jgi:hypothetical protein
VERHGCYKADLEKFAEAIMQKQAAPLLTKRKSTDFNPPEPETETTVLPN